MKDDPRSAVYTETRRLAAIMFTDMVDFSRQMGADETHTLHLLGLHNQIIHQAVTEHRGTVIKTVGDAFLVDFPSVVHAVTKHPSSLSPLACSLSSAMLQLLLSWA
jgi:class 3 adenylate cyclase